jgi:hypothetical protein
MFTWVCPTCGREYDVATKECPPCTAAGAAPSSRPSGWSNLRFWGAVALALAAVVLAAFAWTRWRARRPPPPAGPKIELRRPAEPPPPPRPIEVSGIRLFYDAQNRPQVRAVVINHGDEQLNKGSSLRVALRARESPAGSPPLAYFTAKLDATIQPGDSREVRAGLDALATLAAIPPWQQLRVDIE